jgi:PAS domain S-box-containing protein
LLSLCRQLLVVFYKRKNPSDEDLAPWSRWMVTGNTCAGLIWGIVPWALFPYSSLSDQFLLILVMIGVATAAVTVYWPLLYSCYPIVFLMMGSVGVRFLWEGQDFQLAVGIAAIPMTAILVTMAKYVNALGRESLALRFENDDLIASLKGERDLLERRVEERTSDLEDFNEKLLNAMAESDDARIELAQNERRLKALISNAEDCIFMKDSALTFTHVNPAMLEILERPEKEIIGKKDADLFAPGVAHQFSHIESRVLTGQSIESEHVLSVTNQMRVLKISRTPVRDESGNIIGICGIGRDITDDAFHDFSSSRQPTEYASISIKAILPHLMRVAPGDSTVLLLGESGSGKDYWARWLHEHSHRARGPFFAVNCAALTTEIAESELFGYEPGAFTGANRRKRGLLELAEGGTLLLNEIGELSRAAQAKLLTFLDTRMITRVGGEKTILVDARIVCATNRNLEQEAQDGRFRVDLFHRINVFAVTVPPLRARPEDIPSLCAELLEKIGKRLGRTRLPVVDPQALDILCRRSWPGNVRELMNALERALIQCDGNRIMPVHLGLWPHNASHPTASEDSMNFVLTVSPTSPMNDQIRSAKKALITEALLRSAGNVSAAARLLGISRDVLRHQMKTLGAQDA